ncbi:MAG TPA: type II toxin-antitoxin system VapC family toxin [Caulobacteraceae bacterium]
MIIDASVGVKWLLWEPDRGLAFALLEREEIAAPDLIKLEIGHVLGKRLRRGEISVRFAAEVWRTLNETPVRLEPFRDHLERAFALSLETGTALYDCVYLALAEAEDDVLVTADERFARAIRQARDSDLAARVRLLREFSS